MNEVRDTVALEQMIQTQIIDRGIRDERVLAAMRLIPREMFLSDETRSAAFADRATAIGYGQTISQPYMVALMTARLDLLSTHKVLEIGTGSGYHAAILAKLAREICTVERVKPLLDQAWEKLMSLGIRNVKYRYGDGTLGWPEEAPFDRIIIAAGAPKVPETLLLSHLIDGGLAILPIGEIDKQMLVEVRRHGEKLETTEICPCRFVKLIGKEGWDETREKE